ncbi:MAG: hypothetical protein ACI897_000371, partial [Flavobacteriales bacterium]
MTNSLTRNNNNCCTKTNSTFSGILKGFSLLLFVAIFSLGMNAQGQWYIPDTAVGAFGSGPAMILASTSPGSNYILADQECAQAIYDLDGWCVVNSWDILCLDAYNECLAQPPAQGCMDDSACNYDPLAVVDDASENLIVFESFDGVFAPLPYSLQNAPISDYIGNSQLTISETTWKVLDIASFECASLSNPNALTWNTVISSSEALLSFANPVSNLSFNLGGNGTLNAIVNYDGGSSNYSSATGGDVGVLIEILESNITSIELSVSGAGCFDNLTYSIGSTSCILPDGCTDSTACNYDSTAQCDDGSCNLPDGCTNDTAFNFDASALCDDGSCVFCEPSLVIACPEDTDVACGESTDASFTGEPTTETTECTEEVVLTSEDTLTDNNDGCPFITRTWTATAGDLSDSCDQIITLTDSEYPEFTSVIEDFSLTCEEIIGNESCSEYFEANIALPTFSDSCTLNEDLEVSISYDLSEFYEEELVCPVIAACTRTITVTDQCGNTSSQFTVLSIIDETAPEFINFAADSDIECNIELDLIALTNGMFEDAQSDVSDDCYGEVNITIEYDYIETGECQHVADFLAIVTASDYCGNETTETLTIHIHDTTGPVFPELEDVLVQCLEEVPAPLDLEAIDACTGEASAADIFDSNTGELTKTCELSVAIGAGDDWALWLNEFNAASSDNFVWSAG